MYFNWNGCNVEEFKFEGRVCWVVIPENPTGDWVFKTEYFTAFPDVERTLVEKHGFYAFAIRHTTRFSPDADLECEARFIDFLCEKYSLKKKGSLVGMSMGGSRAVKFAGRYPERVNCMWIDAPVLSFISYPARRHWEGCANEFRLAYPGFERYQMFGSDIHPLCNVDTLIENKIPVFMSYGTEDETVPYAENGMLMAEAYRCHPELLTVVPVGLRGHHPHGLVQDNSKIVEFILENTKD